MFSQLYFFCFCVQTFALVFFFLFFLVFPSEMIILADNFVLYAKQNKTKRWNELKNKHKQTNKQMKAKFQSLSLIFRQKSFMNQYLSFVLGQKKNILVKVFFWTKSGMFWLFVLFTNVCVCVDPPGLCFPVFSNIFF